MIGFLRKALGGSASSERTVEVDPVSVAKNILIQSDIPPFPSYWSGVPAHRDDIGEEDLLKVFSRVEQQVSRDAANCFALMIMNMTSLAPSDVVEAFLVLGKNNWIYDPTEIQTMDSDGVIVPSNRLPEGEMNEELHARMLGAFGAFTNTNEDQTDSIREGFKELLGGRLAEVEASGQIIEG